MSLKAIHIVFVLASISLTAGLGAWSLRNYRASGTREDLWWTIGSFAVALALVIYGRFVLKKLKNIGYL